MGMKIITSDPRARSKPCLRCGYSLVKIESARCPECGLPMFISACGIDALHMSNPAWLRRMRLGLVLMIAGQVISLAEQASHERLWRMFYETGNTFTMAAATIASPLNLALWGASLLLLAGPERRYPEKDRACRLFAFITSILSLLLAALLISVLAAVFGHSLTYLSYSLLNRVQDPVSAVASIAAWLYLRRLAARIPSRRLMTISAVVAILVGLWLLGFGQSTLDPHRQVLINRILVAGYSVLSIILLGCFAWLLTASAREAAATWNSPATTDQRTKDPTTDN